MPNSDDSLRRILVAGSKAQPAPGLVSNLKKAGYGWDQAADLKKARALAEKTEYELILLFSEEAPEKLPAAVKKIHEAAPGTPLILVGKLDGAADEIVAELYDLGAFSVLKVPAGDHAVTEAMLECLTPRHKRWQRKAERVDSVLRVRMKDLANRQSQGSRGLNIGRGGMFLSLHGILPRVGDIVEFEVDDPGDGRGTFSGTAVVRWVRGEDQAQGRKTFSRGIGVEFQFLDHAARKRLAALLQKKQLAYIPRYDGHGEMR